MRFFLKSVAYLFHPLIMPLLGVIIYFGIAPRFTPHHIVFSNVFGLLIVTVLTPIVLLFFLKNLNFIDAIQLPTLDDRRIPLLLQIGLFILTTRMLINIYDYPELYYFFAGVLFATMLTLVCVLIGIKTSLHTAGAAAITTFTIALSIHFSINQIILIAGLFFLNGLIASAAIQEHQQTSRELFIGILIGVLPQVLLFQLWM